MLRRFVWILVAFPVTIVLVTLAVANRHGVRLVLDPFRPNEPVLSLVLPFYVYLFGVLGLSIEALGRLIGAGAAGHIAGLLDRDGTLGTLRLDGLVSVWQGSER